MKLPLLFSILVAIAAVCSAQPANDKINSLPFLAGTLGNQYSGYLHVNATRFYHYWFVQSQGTPATDPVVLWLNGGPGCSSLEGYMYEHGPYLWGQNHANLTLVDNPYSWTKVANVIYLESPAGVGFSYGTDNNDYNTNDDQTALDNYDFLQAWFQNFPSYKTNPFFIAGESYAGVYVPMLAQLIVAGNTAGNPKINLKGILVGNGVSNSEGDGTMTSFVPFTYGHGLMSPATYDTIMKYCPTAPNGSPCQSAINAAYKAYRNIDPYNIIGNCYSQGSAVKTPVAFLKARPAPLETPPCVDSTKGISFLNTASVKQAIHVQSKIKWDICSDKLNYNPNAGSMIPIYKGLLQNNVRVLIYSGDVDSVVPYTGTAYWTRNLMGLTPLSEWQQWSYNDAQGPQVGGFVTTYANGFTFTTVRAAGHMVPQTARAAALSMFTNFVNNRQL